MSKLEEMLKYVSEHNEFYKNRIKEYGIKDPLDITQWPILTRKELQENRYNMFSEGYKSKYYSQQLIRSASSGSSGIPVNVYNDYCDYYLAVRYVWKNRLKYYGVHPNDKHILFTLPCFDNVNGNEEIKYINDPKNILNINVSTIQNNNAYAKMIDIINGFEPTWLYVRPYILQKLIINYIKFNKKIPSSLKYIESYGEVLSVDLQEKARELFKVPIVNMYGSEEMNTIAYECPYHNMHINSSVFVECSNSSGIHCIGTGEAIITSVTNKAMPLIRYNQGDLITLSKAMTPCACGSFEPIVSAIKGRTLDGIKISSDCELNSAILLEIMGEVNNMFGGMIECYKFIYSPKKKIVQCFVEIDSKARDWTSNIVKSVKAQFRRVILNSDVSLIVTVIENIKDLKNKHLIFEISD